MVVGSRQLPQLMGCRVVPSPTLHCCTMQDQLAEQAEQAQFQIKALQAKAEKLQLAADQALAQKREAEQQRKAFEREAHNTKQALDARVVRHVPVPGLLSAQVHITCLSSTRPKSPGCHCPGRGSTVSVVWYVQKHAGWRTDWSGDCSRGPPLIHVIKGAFQLILL